MNLLITWGKSSSDAWVKCSRYCRRIRSCSVFLRKTRPLHTQFSSFCEKSHLSETYHRSLPPSCTPESGSALHQGDQPADYNRICWAHNRKRHDIWRGMWQPVWKTHCKTEHLSSFLLLDAWSATGQHTPILLFCFEANWNGFDSPASTNGFLITLAWWRWSPTSQKA